MSVTSVRFNSDLETPLEELAKKLDRSKNYLINQAVKEFIQRKGVVDWQRQELPLALKGSQTFVRYKAKNKTIK